MNYMDRLNTARRISGGKKGNGKQEGGTFSPRSLYRGLTVPWSNKPGRKRIHPKERRAVESL